MKKLTMLAAALALAVPAPLALPAPAIAGSNAATVDFCKYSVVTDPTLTVGQCVGQLTTELHYYQDGKSAGGFWEKICAYAERNRPDDFYAVYDSKAECIQDEGAQLF